MTIRWHIWSTSCKIHSINWPNPMFWYYAFLAQELFSAKRICHVFYQQDVLAVVVVVVVGVVVVVVVGVVVVFVVGVDIFVLLLFKTKPPEFWSRKVVRDGEVVPLQQREIRHRRRDQSGHLQIQQVRLYSNIYFCTWFYKLVLFLDCIQSMMNAYSEL